MFSTEDNYRHKGLRRKLVDDLRQRGIQSEAVLEAMMKVPRHLFLDQAFEEWAYKDSAFPIECDQTISQPYTVAFQTQLLEIQPKDKVLEIGLGSGYQACVLSALGAKVYSIERHQRLHDMTVARLKEIGYASIRTFYGDGFEGLPRFAPFDKVLITAAVDKVPDKLLDQLNSPGILVFPKGSSDGTQIMTKICKDKEGKISTLEFGHFKFVPMLKGKV